MLVSLSLAALAPALGAPVPTPSEWAQVVAGEVVTRNAPEIEPSGAYAWVEIAATPDAIWTVLTDPAQPVASSSAIKSCTQYRDEPLPGGGRRVGWAYSLSVAMSDVQYHLLRELHPAERTLTWTLDPARDNDIVASSGSFSLSPGRTAGKQLLTYQSQVDTGKKIPAFIQTFLTSRTLAAFLARVQSEAEAR